MGKEIDKIFQLLSDDGFKDPDTGLLFFPAYVYTYPAEEEYLIRKQINVLNEKLKRPSNNLNCLVINVFEEFVKMLKEEEFASGSIYDEIINLEEDDYKDAKDFLKEKAQDEDFIQEIIGNRIQAYFDTRTDDKIYLLLHGFGSIFPYLRVSHFLKNTEHYIKNFKLIVFYPGNYTNAKYSLFGEFNDDNVYRANHLNQLLTPEI